MRAVTANILRLAREVHDLAKRHAWLSRRHRLDDEIRTKLATIADSGEWWAIPDFIALALHSRAAIAEAACAAVNKLSAQVQPRHLAVFDRLFRDRSPYFRDDYYAWRCMEPGDLDALETLEHGRAALRMALCHPSGYVRSAAIRLCAARPDGTELPYLLLRTADWVEPVRRFALETTRALLPEIPLRAVVGSLPLADQMSGWARSQASPVVADMKHALDNADGQRLLRNALASPDRFVRRAAARRLLAAGDSSADDVLRLVLRDSDPVLRAWACRQLLDGDPTGIVRFRSELLGSGSGWIRFQAAQRLIEAGEPPAWRNLLFDGHGGVRELAQDLALEADAEPDTEYRKAVGTLDGAALACALLGLSETGGPGDLPTLARFLESERPRVRRTALVALAKLDDPNIIERCLGAFADDAPSVVHTACGLLQRRIQHVPPDRAWELFATATTPAAAKDALFLLAQTAFWPRLPYLLRALELTEGGMRDRVEHYLLLWYRRLTKVFTAPSAAVISDARAALATDAAAKYRTEFERVLAHRVNKDALI